VIDQQLTMRIRARPKRHDDAVFYGFGNQLAQAVRDKFEQDTECARVTQGDRVVDDLLCQRSRFPL